MFQKGIAHQGKYMVQMWAINLQHYMSSEDDAVQGFNFDDGQD